MTLIGDIFYEYHGTQSTYLEARAICHSRGLELATLASEEEKLNIDIIVGEPITINGFMSILYFI